MNVYVIKAKEQKKKPIVKIGKAANVEARLRSLQTGNPFALTVDTIIPCRSEMHAYAVENELHSIFKDLRIQGEWYLYTANLKNYIQAKIAGDVDRMERAVSKHTDQVAKSHFKWHKVKWPKAHLA